MGSKLRMHFGTFPCEFYAINHSSILFNTIMASYSVFTALFIIGIIVFNSAAAIKEDKAMANSLRQKFFGSTWQNLSQYWHAYVLCAVSANVLKFQFYVLIFIH